MSRFVNTETGVVVNVDDSKDDRFASALWSSEAQPESQPKAKAEKPKPEK